MQNNKDLIKGHRDSKKMEKLSSHETCETNDINKKRKKNEKKNKKKKKKNYLAAKREQMIYSKGVFTLSNSVYFPKTVSLC